MPTRLDTNLPRPTNPGEFESIIRDICAYEWGDKNTQKFGRKGQKQFGVDIYGLPTTQQKVYRGAQCKLRTKDDNLSETEIQTEVTSARQFPHQLDTLILATDAPRDTETQILVDRVSERETEKGGFRVVIWFWDDITERLATYPNLLVKYYRDYYANLTTLPIVERLIDRPIQLIYTSLDSSDQSTNVEKALRFRGIRISKLTNKQLNAKPTNIDEHFPDGIVCVFDTSKINNIDALIDSYLVTLQGYIHSTDDECPIIALISSIAIPSLMHAAKNQRLDIKRISILDLEKSVNDLADHIFKIVFPYGYTRRGGLSTIEVCVRTHSRRPNSALLDLDWGEKLSTSLFPSPDEWGEMFVPAIASVREHILTQGDVARIQINSQLPIPAAIAFGYSFNLRVSRIGVWARQLGVSDFNQQFWLSDSLPGPYIYQPDWIQDLSIGGKSAILELTSYVSIHEMVKDFVSTSAIEFDAWIMMGMEVDGRSSENLTEGEALAFANQVGQVVRQLNGQGITNVHLFARIPSALGILVGQRLLACGRIHLYWFSNSTYRYAFSLPETDQYVP